MYTLVEDLVAESLDRPYVCFSPKVAEALGELKEFNRKQIYESKKVKRQTDKIRLMFELLFEKYFLDLEKGNEGSDIYREFLDGMSPENLKESRPPEIVRDFIAGMTDEYFLDQCQRHLIPQIEPSLRYVS